MSVDAFLMLCQAFERLSRSYPDDSPSLSDRQGHNKARSDIIGIQSVKTNDPVVAFMANKKGEPCLSASAHTAIPSCYN